MIVNELERAPLTDESTATGRDETKKWTPVSVWRLGGESRMGTGGTKLPMQVAGHFPRGLLPPS